MIDFDILRKLNKIEDVIREMGAFQLGERGNTIHKRALEHSSFVVDTRRQYYFWNKHGRGGSVIDYLINEHNMNIVDVAHYLARRAGVEMKLTDEQKAAYEVKRERGVILDTITQFLHGCLLSDATGMAYVEERGWDEATAKQERLGYWHVRYKKQLEETLMLNSIAFDHPLVVAVMGYYGDVVAWGQRWGIEPREKWAKNGHINGMYGREGGTLIYTHMSGGKADYISGRGVGNVDRWFKHWKPPTELAGPQRPFFNSLATGHDYVVIVEGQADMVTLAHWQVPAIALAGLSNQFSLAIQLAKYGLVYVATDNDEAGQLALEQNKPLGQLLEQLGGLARIVTWPAKDANEWLLSGGNEEKCQQILGRSPTYVEMLADKAAKAGPLDKDKLQRHALQVASRLPDYEAALLQDAVAKKLGISIRQYNKAAKALKAVSDIDEKKAAEADLGKEELALLLEEQADHEGHAQTCWRLYKEGFAYVPKWGWFAYTGKYWLDQNGEQAVDRAITETLRRRQEAADAAGRDDLFLSAKANRLQRIGTRSQLESIAAVTTDRFDASPHLLNVANGVVDLRTGELVAHSPSQYFTYCLDVDYRPSAEDEDYSWIVFLTQVIGGSNEEQKTIIEFLQEAVGYTLTGLQRERALMYLHGPTAAGKGAFMETLSAILNKPLGQTVNFQTLTSERTGDTQNFDLAPLKPARLLWADEGRSHGRVNEENMKRLTGGGEIWCSHKGKPHFSYLPQFTIWLTSNFPLSMSPEDMAAWARVFVINFPHSFVGKEDKGLKRRLMSKTSLEAVLAWAVAGAKRWYQRESGFVVPKQVLVWREQMRDDQDMISLFLDEVCHIVDPTNLDVFTPTGVITSKYKEWCKLANIRPKGLKAIRAALDAKGFTRAKKRYTPLENARAGFLGIMLEDENKPIIEKASKKKTKPVQKKIDL